MGTTATKPDQRRKLTIRIPEAEAEWLSSRALHNRVSMNRLIAAMIRVEMKREKETVRNLGKDGNFRGASELVKALASSLRGNLSLH